MDFHHAHLLCLTIRFKWTDMMACHNMLTFLSRYVTSYPKDEAWWKPLTLVSYGAMAVHNKGKNPQAIFCKETGAKRWITHTISNRYEKISTVNNFDRNSLLKIGSVSFLEIKQPPKHSNIYTIILTIIL